MATTEFIAAIELGSSKITGVAGKKNSDGSMQVLAYAQEDSSTFIRKGVIFNLDKTAQSLTSIINRLEGELCNARNFPDRPVLYRKYPNGRDLWP